jgi:hypothetical protein
MNPAVSHCVAFMNAGYETGTVTKQEDATRAIRMLIAYDPRMSTTDIERHCRTIGRRTGRFYARAKWLGPLVDLEYHLRDGRLNLVLPGMGKVGERLFHLGVVRGSELIRLRHAFGGANHIDIAITTINTTTETCFPIQSSIS